MVSSVSSATSWALFKEQVDDTIVKALQPKIIYPLLLKTYPANGPVMEYNTTNSWLNPGEVSEGAEYGAGVLDFTRNYATVKDVGIAPRIPINWVKDARWDLVNDYVEQIGFGIARSINTDTLNALYTFNTGGSYGGQTVAAGGHNSAATAVWSATNADVLTDITKALATLEADDAGDGKKYLVLHPTPMSYLRVDPNLVKFINYGDASLIQKGIYPTPFGIDILVSSQANSTYGILDNVDLSAGKYYEREPLTTEMDKQVRSKMLDITAYLRYAIAVARPKGLAVITGVG